MFSFGMAKPFISIEEKNRLAEPGSHFDVLWFCFVDQGRFANGRVVDQIWYGNRVLFWRRMEAPIRLAAPIWAPATSTIHLNRGPCRSGREISDCPISRLQDGDKHSRSGGWYQIVSGIGRSKMK